MKIPFFSPGNSAILPFPSSSSPRPPGNSARGIQFSAAPWLASWVERQQRKSQISPSTFPPFPLEKEKGDFLQTNLLSLSVTPFLLLSQLRSLILKRWLLNPPLPLSILPSWLVAIINTSFWTIIPFTLLRFQLLAVNIGRVQASDRFKNILEGRKGDFSVSFPLCNW